MFASITHKGKTYNVDLAQPIDISMPLRAAENAVRAWYADPLTITPVKNGDWVGEVKQGGSVNFRNIFFNPHAHGTHTETVGHISVEDYPVNQHLKQFFFIAEVVTVLPESRADGDYVITKTMLEELLEDKKPEAIIIRTLSNSPVKLTTNYSNTNPPYLEAAAATWLVQRGVNHLLIDMPSVDKEVDGGALAAHHAFWEYPHNTQAHRTITEMIYVPNDVYDGAYLLNLQIASFENDATPSKPVLFRIAN